MAERRDAVNEVDELVLERVFDAPRELVWRAWTDPEQLVQWWGPHEFTTPYCTIDLRVGGEIRFCMRNSQYGDFWSGGVYQVIDPPSRIVVTDYFTDEHGNKVPATHYGMSEGLPDEATISVEFEDIGDGKTKLTLRHGLPSWLPETAEAAEGWSQSFEKLAAYLTTAG